jgi:hypothetical protein
MHNAPGFGVTRIPANSQRNGKETASVTFARNAPLCTPGEKASLKSRSAAA